MKQFFPMLLTFLLLILSNGICHTANNDFRVIKTIGDNERDNYTMFFASDSVLGPNNDIFILQAKGNFVSHYSWSGEFQQRIGQKGSGPGDFYFPQALDFRDNKLYILEKGNNRIAEFYLKTKEFKYYKEKVTNRLASEFFVLNHNKFLGIFDSMGVNRGRIGVLNQSFDIQHTFFDEFPFNLKVDKAKYETPTTVETIARKVFFSNFSQPSIYFNRKKKEILVSFIMPDNPIRFFVYDLNGKLLKTFSHKLKEEKYKFQLYKVNGPLDMLRDPNKWPKRFELFIDCVASYENHYIAIINLDDYVKKKRIKRTKYCLVLDNNGVLKKRIPLDSELMVHKLSKGYFLGSTPDAEVEQFFVFKLNL